MGLRILLAEDDANLRLLLERQLGRMWDVVCASDGTEALEILGGGGIDLLLTDLSMPGLNGLELVAAARGSFPDLPILILTANQNFDARKGGFQAGTDDFLTKPFSREELVWRIQALLRRTAGIRDNQLEAFGLRADKSRRCICFAGKETILPEKEFGLLWKLLGNRDRIVTHRQLFQEVWGFDSESSDDTVKTHISRLRKHLEGMTGFRIVAVRGVGYRLGPEAGGADGTEDNDSPSGDN